MAVFHLSLAVPDLESSMDFFTGVLAAQVTHVDGSGYVNLELAGVQLTLTRASGPITPAPDVHFGINLDLAGFRQLAERAQSMAPKSIVAAPHVVDAGTPRARHKLYLRCPAGYLVEIKGS